MGALTKHAWHAKSQSAATFRQGAMRVFAATTPSLILYPHPLKVSALHCNNEVQIVNKLVVVFQKNTIGIFVCSP